MPSLQIIERASVGVRLRERRERGEKGRRGFPFNVLRSGIDHLRKPKGTETETDKSIEPKVSGQRERDDDQEKKIDRWRRLFHSHRKPIDSANGNLLLTLG
jgi:hypothetical protein